ncbi:MAG: hypothetical protein ACRC4T_04675 [Cetobacterium sp.]
MGKISIFNVQAFVNIHNKVVQCFGGITEEIVYARIKVALINEKRI